MFDDGTLTTRKRIDRDYAERRMRWEPLYEITQIKGDGEAHPALSPNDEFADFDTWDKGSFGATKHTANMLPREYAREALKRGLAYEKKLGVNPFKFGVVGATDAHTSLSTTREENNFGKVSIMEPSEAARAHYMLQLMGIGPSYATDLIRKQSSKNGGPPHTISATRWSSWDNKLATRSVLEKPLKYMRRCCQTMRLTYRARRS